MNKFQTLITDKEIVKKLITGSDVKGASYEWWKRARSAITEFVTHDGTILDIGCANGFLLLCLQNWSKHKLVLYGVDPDDNLIQEAQQLFPSNFDYIYWNVWDNRKLDNVEELGWLSMLFGYVNVRGSLILGFYDKDKQNNWVRVKNVEKAVYTINKILETTDAGNEVFVQIRK